ncbi:hypothetical protein BD769DRAFT_1477286 [Suillus cothurnatus]|nr:hypothetical protein BD769DRAFT_1477286 [Suillus cothurnatus]
MQFLTMQTRYSIGIIFLHLARSEPNIKYYAVYAGAHAIVTGKNEATKPQLSAESAHETTRTGPRGVSENADLLV